VSRKQRTRSRSRSRSGALRRRARGRIARRTRPTSRSAKASDGLSGDNDGFPVRWPEREVYGLMRIAGVSTAGDING